MQRKIKETTGNNTINHPASYVFTRLNYITRGWASYFRHGASKTAFSDLQHYLWWRVWIWLRKKHPNKGLKWVVRRYHPYQGWQPSTDGVDLYQPATMAIQRYRWRGTIIPTPWTQTPRHATT
ncbi:group II intron maturase-specific domain-containing protein [Amycolatopsis taiwanensis]|uniref:group II intron maturase-specific domain-containing protein n=1 Tax=Amycolatopsis taiwanensis TaxID=342230 RepID=UPI002553ED07|nr:group II intron maturase-specific domain-containing protein [Amycolatopsis taiwanensis]